MTQPENHARLEEDARAWLVRLNAGPLDEDAKTAFTNWVQASRDHASAFRKTRRVWQLVGGADTALDDLIEILEAENPASASRRMVPGRPLNRRFWAAGSIAACLVLAIAAVFLMRPSVPVAPVSHSAGLDGVMIIDLDDGSQLTLRPSSTVEVMYSAESRAVNLVEGRAFFDVAYDAGRPFVATAHETQVRVLGTGFDMRKDAGLVNIAVSEGRVDVVDLASRLDDTPGDTLTLVAGQQVQAGARGGLSEIHSIDPEAATAWIRGDLVYNGASLSEIITDLNAYRPDKIEIADPALELLTITTAFNVTQADQVLETLAELYGIEIQRSGNTVRLTRARP